MNGLTPKQERFALNIFEGMSQREAYIQAGYSSKQAFSTIDRNAFELARTNKIVARLEELYQEIKSEKVMLKQERLEVLSEIARGRFAEFTSDGEITLDDDNLKSAALAEIKETNWRGGKGGRAESKTTSIKLRDPISAIDLLNKMDKIYSENSLRVDVNVVFVVGRGYADS